jgi:hypothetical protein
MKTAQAIFGALAAAVGLAAVVTFYDEFLPGTQMPPHPNEAAEKGDLWTPASSIAHDFAVCRSPFIPRRRVQSRKTLLCCRSPFVRPPQCAHRRYSPRWGRRRHTTATESEPRPATPRVEFSSVATTLSSRAEPVDFCAKYGGHRVHFKIVDEDLPMA